MIEGFAAIASSRVLVGVLTGMAVTMLGLGMVNVLLVPMVINDLGLPETWFGAIELAQVSSMVLSGALLAVLAARFKPTNIVSVALIGAGVCVGALAGVGSVWGLMAVLFSVGWFVTPLQASVVSLLQSNVVDEMRGRAGAALSTASQTASVVSMAMAGILADAIGVRGVFLLGGAISIAAGLVSAAIFRGQDPEQVPVPPLEPATEGLPPTTEGGSGH
jgi:sugar phosphate permease